MIFLSSRITKSFFKIILTTVVLFFSSCLTIESELTINSNGSGSMKIKYIMDSGLKGVSEVGSDDDVVPLNLSESYIKNIIDKRDDISYTNYNITEDMKYYRVDVTFNFTNIDALNSIFPAESRIDLKSDENGTIFTQQLIEESDKVISDETIELFKELFKDNYFKLILNTPSDIISVDKVDNVTKIGKRTAQFEDSFMNVLLQKERSSWSVRW